MRFLRYRSAAGNKFRYSAVTDELHINFDVWPLIQEHEHYFILIDSCTIQLKTSNDWFFREEIEFSARCIKSRLKYLGISIKYCGMEQNRYIIRFKTEADLAFFTLRFSTNF